MRLLGQEWVGGRLERTWLHTGDDGKDRITVETVQDVAPVFKSVRHRTENDSKDFRFKAEIPGTMIEDAARINAPLWGVPRREAFREIVANKTDRAKAVWKTFTQGRDYRKLQAKAWR